MTPSEKIRALLRILEDQNAERSKHIDVDQLMTVPRYQGIHKKNLKKVTDLIRYLDQFSAFKKYRQPNANYDDAYYVNLPMSLVNRITGLTLQDLQKIVNSSGKYQGHIVNSQGKLTIFGRD